MLHVPESPVCYRILSIDPGTDTLGVGVLDCDLKEGQVQVQHGGTLVSSRGLHFFDHIEESFGTRQAKLHSHAQRLHWLLHHYQPQAVICESPYMGRFAQAFRALVECLTMIQSCVHQYNPSLAIETVDPPSAKKAVGASGRGGDKNPIRRAIAQLQWLEFHPSLDLSQLDEHAIDALAVGIYKCNQVFA